MTVLLVPSSFIEPLLRGGEEVSSRRWEELKDIETH